MNITDQNYIMDPSLSLEEEKYAVLNSSFDPAYQSRDVISTAQFHIGIPLTAKNKGRGLGSAMTIKKIESKGLTASPSKISKGKKNFGFNSPKNADLSPLENDALKSRDEKQENYKNVTMTLPKIN